MGIMHLDVASMCKDGTAKHKPYSVHRTTKMPLVYKEGVFFVNSRQKSKNKVIFFSLSICQIIIVFHFHLCKAFGIGFALCFIYLPSKSLTIYYYFGIIFFYRESFFNFSSNILTINDLSSEMHSHQSWF